MKKLVTILYLSLILFTLHSQDAKGYWDVVRSPLKKFQLQPHTVRMYEIDIPYGTTQLVYRLTVLQTSQDIPNKLAGIASSFKTPEALIAGAALKLGSALIGTDKCSFYIYQNKKDALNNVGKNACDAIPNATQCNGYLNNKCITIYSNKIYVVVETININFPSNIVIEILPWVEPDKERGWSKEAIIKTKEVLVKDYNEDIIDCIAEKLVKDYSVMELVKIGAENEKKVLDEYSMACLDELGISKDLYNEIDNNYRNEADSLIGIKKYTDAIDIYLMLDEDTSANDMDYNSLGWCYLLTKQYLKAIKYLKKGEKIDETNLLIQENLAHAYLLSNNFEKAKEIYIKYKGFNVDETQSWEDSVKEDFKTFAEMGIKSDKYNQILELLMN